MEEKLKYGGGYTCNVCGKYNRTSTLCHHDKLISDNMKQLPTAEEFLNDKFKEIYYKQPKGLTSNLSETRFLELHVTGRINGVEKNYPEMMIEFAKLHVQAALESAAENAICFDDYIAVDKQSILDSYPLENIK